MEIYYDSIQEGIWFKGLSENLEDSILLPFPPRNKCPDWLVDVLSLDRPDIVLVDKEQPILVLERTTEVPSGHNVGQRFGRLVAAAIKQIPAIYFGPYMAYKHGGKTQGPRYMNLRLFYALNEVAKIESTAITTINWPVDKNCEIIQTANKDDRMRIYLDLFFRAYFYVELREMCRILMDSDFEKGQQAERNEFKKTKVVDAAQYDSPPPSVIIASWELIQELSSWSPTNLIRGNVVFYNVGMKYIRSDPYAGSALLYSYLYCGGLRNRTKDFILYFPNISIAMWSDASQKGGRKDIRMFKIVADGILFKDGYLPSSEL